jgi:PDDEXK-like domain of unknown function (DUF3799)
MNTLTDPVHFSNLKKLSESPAHYRDSIGKDEDKLSYRIGRLTHALRLGVQPGVKWDVYDGTRRGKEWEAFKAARPGGDIFTKTEHALAKAMALSIDADPLATSLIKGRFEVPVEWTHETGRRCATRGIDVLNAEDEYTVELKTAVSSQPERFTRDALRMGYHAQGSWFRDAATWLGVRVKRHYVIAVEKKPPHVVTVFVVTERALVEGQKLCRSWMEQLKVCEEANAWPGYAQYVVELDTRADDEDLVLEDDEDGGDDGEEVAA